MVTSPNEWKILEWDEKLQMNKQTNCSVLVTINVESLLFVVDQCSWISCFTLTHEFTSQRTYNIEINRLMTYCNEQFSHEITPKRTSKILIIHEYCWNKTEFTLVNFNGHRSEYFLQSNSTNQNLKTYSYIQGSSNAARQTTSLMASVVKRGSDLELWVLVKKTSNIKGAKIPNMRPQIPSNCYRSREQKVKHFNWSTDFQREPSEAAGFSSQLAILQHLEHHHVLWKKASEIVKHTTRSLCWPN